MFENSSVADEPSNFDRSLKLTLPVLLPFITNSVIEALRFDFADALKLLAVLDRHKDHDLTLFVLGKNLLKVRC